MCFGPNLRCIIGITFFAVAGCMGCDERLSRPAAAMSANVRLNTEDAQLLAAIRAATARYLDVDVARANGYVDDDFGCVGDSTSGGRGWHFINEARHADPETDPLRPDVLVYAPGPEGKLTLVALEYAVNQQDWFAAGHTQPPRLLGREFQAIDAPPRPLMFALHVWAWNENGSGMFAAFNPEVTCP